MAGSSDLNRRNQQERRNQQDVRKLMLKAILGLAFLMVFLAIALFLSAGSLGFWQAWVYLAVFFSSSGEFDPAASPGRPRESKAE